MTCSHCIYWVRLWAASDLGSCHRYAPRAAVVSNVAGAMDTVTIWPKTVYSDGCGEFQGEFQSKEDSA